MTNVEVILQKYSKNDMQLLKRISRSILSKMNDDLSDMDYDDFYSIANETLWKACETYSSDMGATFETFLCSCIRKKFSTEIRDRHREKRVLNLLAVPLEASENEEGNCALDLLPSDFDTFEEAMKLQSNKQFQDKVQRYISKLSNQQVSILNLLIDGYKPKDIQQILNISAKEYSVNMKIMQSFENVKILF